MRTPCQDNPDLWTSDVREERALAVAECGTCWRLTECAAEVADLLARKLKVAGVAGGVDWTRTKAGTVPKRGKAPARVAVPAPNECAGCGATLRHPERGRRRTWCSERCRNATRKGQAA